MPSAEALKKYAHLLVCGGCNLQPGQELYVSADVTQAPLVRMVVAEAYAAGASNVTSYFSDEQISRINYDSKSVEACGQFPEWRAVLQNGVAERGAALLFISSEDPMGFAGVDPKKLSAFQVAATKACRAWRDGMDFGRNVWVIAGAASPAWAARVFPDLPEEEAVERLWDAILLTARADGDDPLADWHAHDESFRDRAAWLNQQRFDALRYRNSLGTDLVIGLNADGLWAGGGETTVGGQRFYPNMPTEEIYTTPDWRRVDGVAVASMPLNHGGALVRDFRVEFKDGRVCGWSAAEGEDILASIIETDEGAHHLGECALVPFGNPIQRMGVLFLNTLYDENAACHLALGRGFAECVEGGRDLDAETLKERGVNDSLTHVDFMIGTADLTITGIRADGEEVPVFINGAWA